jgi:hypothetical protein
MVELTPVSDNDFPVPKLGDQLDCRVAVLTDPQVLHDMD